MSNPVAKPSPKQGSQQTPVVFTNTSNPKALNAFDLLMKQKDPKKTTSCKMPNCGETVYLVVGKSTCEKCKKVFCRIHVPEDKHECTGTKV